MGLARGRREVVRSRTLGLSGRRIICSKVDGHRLLTGCAVNLSVSVFGTAKAQSQGAQAVETEAER